MDKRINRKINNYIGWLFINIFLPLLPVILKIILQIFGNSDKFSVAILDTSELLYYSLFVCVTFYNHSFQKKEIMVYEAILRIAFFFTVLVDMTLIILLYTQANELVTCKMASLVLSIVVPISVALYEFYEGVYIK